VTGRLIDKRLYGAMFLMATSAIGPRFITQTAQFTAQLGAAFAFAILVSIFIDIALQLNVWRVIGVSGLGRRTSATASRRALGACSRFSWCWAASSSTSAMSRALDSASRRCWGSIRSGAGPHPH